MRQTVCVSRLRGYNDGMSDEKIFDEMWGRDEQLRDPYANFQSWFDGEDPARLRAKQREADDLFRLTGITFNVYGRQEAEERLIPFDIVPRVIAQREWQKLSRGIEQRVRAINAFLNDIYGRQEIIKAGRLPQEMIAKNAAFLPQMIGVHPPGGVYTHIVGIDLVRTDDNEFYVLEDNARTPSGVSYMLENRETMLHMFPELFAKNNVLPVSTYPADLRRSLAACAPPACDGPPTVAVLTPGIYNSAYFEHSFLADQFGFARGLKHHVVGQACCDRLRVVRIDRGHIEIVQVLACRMRLAHSSPSHDDRAKLRRHRKAVLFRAKAGLSICCATEENCLPNRAERQSAQPSKKRQSGSDDVFRGSCGMRSGQPNFSHASTIPIFSANSMKPGWRRVRFIGSISIHRLIKLNMLAG